MISLDTRTTFLSPRSIVAEPCSFVWIGAVAIAILLTDAAQSTAQHSANRGFESAAQHDATQPSAWQHADTWQPTPPPHRILRSPASRSTRPVTDPHSSSAVVGPPQSMPGTPPPPQVSSATHHVKRVWDHATSGPWSASVNRKWDAMNQKPGPAIPSAATRPAWKTPYSYGYFGARGSRHWSRQYGYRDGYSQWTLR
ncbi:hypothetical protein Pan14r_27320 [Crateriforma conspicua]|uniref:Uncharacterized protein n=1 Tax=Crateriforma conspicua TaxID=2527996 RepID=A0A5C5Y3T2_9PLAN|nr:hypothetical protein Mal65_41980 [Crateriforma conspicua]TWT70426.1 hypothetical protein Pan14r_27320 [Crateriforma conspicua]